MEYYSLCRRTIDILNDDHHFLNDAHQNWNECTIYLPVRIIEVNHSLNDAHQNQGWTVLTNSIPFKLLFCVISLVSLPKHKVSGGVKGFAFVEFSTEEEVHATLEVCVCERGWWMCMRVYRQGSL